MDTFNSFIDSHYLREIHRVGGKYTWTNKQQHPIKSNIDRVLMTTEWESKFPLLVLSSLTRLGSDPCPLLLDTGEIKSRSCKQFFFEKQWIKKENFLELISTKWQIGRDK